MRYLTVRQAADRLGIHPETVREKCRQTAALGGLDAIKSGPGRTCSYRIREDEVEAYAARYGLCPEAVAA